MAIDPVIAAASVLSGLAFVGVGVGAWMLTNPYRTPQDRLRSLSESAERPPQFITDSDPIMRRREVPSLMRRLAALATPGKPEEISLLRQSMLQAGLKAHNALEIYLITKVLLALTLPIVAGLFLPGATVAMLSLALLGSASVGYYVPNIYVANLTQRRKQSISKSIPDALDLLVSCTEAGLGLDAAFMRVAENLGEASPELAGELNVVTAEVGAGVPRSEALRRLEQRTGTPELTSLVNVLIQADRLGTPVAQALRVYAATTRTRRMLAAEEKAAAISPKLTVAMVLFLLPSLFMVILGPAIVNIFREVIPTLAGQ
jgi:tight adherence protein C